MASETVTTARETNENTPIMEDKHTSSEVVENELSETNDYTLSETSTTVFNSKLTSHIELKTPTKSTNLLSEGTKKLTTKETLEDNNVKEGTTTINVESIETENMNVTDNEGLVGYTTITKENFTSMIPESTEDTVKEETSSTTIQTDNFADIDNDVKITTKQSENNAKEDESNFSTLIHEKNTDTANDNEISMTTDTTKTKDITKYILDTDLPNGLDTEVTKDNEDTSTKVTAIVTSSPVSTTHKHYNVEQSEEYNLNTPVYSKQTFQANENIKTQSENTETTKSLTDGETKKISGENGLTLPKTTQSTNMRTTVRMTQDTASIKFETLGAG